MGGLSKVTDGKRQHFVVYTVFVPTRKQTKFEEQANATNMLRFAEAPENT